LKNYFLIPDRNFKWVLASKLVVFLGFLSSCFWELCSADAARRRQSCIFWRNECFSYTFREKSWSAFVGVKLWVALKFDVKLTKGFHLWQAKDENKISFKKNKRAYEQRTQQDVSKKV
jgi:hypothetical protein